MPIRHNARSVELRHLRYFLAVAQQGTVTAAAEQLHVAQPAISRQLRSLERELGITLFNRNGPRLALTAAGREMVEIATDIVQRSDRATDAAHAMAAGHLTRLNVAAGPNTIRYLLAPFVATLKPTDPLVWAHQVASHAVHASVLGGYDLGITGEPPLNDRLSCRPVMTVTLRAYVAADHPWASDRQIMLDQLVAEMLILPPPGEPTRVTLDAAVREAQLSYSHVENSRSTDLSQALAAAGRGVAVATDLRQFDVVPVRIVDRAGQPVQLSLHACWVPHHYAHDAIEKFAERLAAYIDQVASPRAELELCRTAS